MTCALSYKIKFILLFLIIKVTVVLIPHPVNGVFRQIFPFKISLKINLKQKFLFYSYFYRYFNYLFLNVND